MSKKWRGSGYLGTALPVLKSVERSNIGIANKSWYLCNGLKRRPHKKVFLLSESFKKTGERDALKIDSSTFPFEDCFSSISFKKDEKQDTIDDIENISLSVNVRH